MDFAAYSLEMWSPDPMSSSYDCLFWKPLNLNRIYQFARVTNSSICESCIFLNNPFIPFNSTHAS